MQCRNNEIQELLPAYEQQLLDRNDRSRVERHLASCGDCAKELAMIRMLGDEPVPDPGEAFWTALPGRVFREVREQERQKRSWTGAFLPGRPFIPRWAWAGAAVVLLGAMTWFMVRPSAVDFPDLARLENGSAPEELPGPETIDLAELDDAQLGSLNAWASRELASLQDGISDVFTNGLDASTDDKLAELDAQELERLSQELDEYGEEEG